MSRRRTLRGGGQAKASRQGEEGRGGGQAKASRQGEGGGEGGEGGEGGSACPKEAIEGGRGAICL